LYHNTRVPWLLPAGIAGLAAIGLLRLPPLSCNDPHPELGGDLPVQFLST
jgi:hypothetical protein